MNRKIILHRVLYCICYIVVGVITFILGVYAETWDDNEFKGFNEADRQRAKR